MQLGARVLIKKRLHQIYITIPKSKEWSISKGFLKTTMGKLHLALLINGVVLRRHMFHHNFQAIKQIHPLDCKGVNLTVTKKGQRIAT
jgi:hypothetical protein